MINLQGSDPPKTTSLYMSQYRAKKKSRKSKIKYKKKKAIWKSFAFRITLLAVIFAVLLAYLLLFSPLLAIKEIRIAAPDNLNNVVPAVQKLINQEIEKRFVFVLNRKSFFLLNTKNIREKIEQMEPSIEEATITKKFLNTLFIELKGRTAQAIWCHAQDGNCYLLDKKGAIFKKTEQKDLPIILTESELPAKMPSEVISQAKIAQILEVSNFFNEKLKITPQSLFFDGQERLNLKTQEGWEVYFLLGGDIKASLTKLGLLLEKTLTPEQRKNLQYIDLRFSKVYYK